MAGMGEVGGVKLARSLRAARRSFPEDSMSIESGLVAMRLPLSEAPFLNSRSATPKPGAMTALGWMMDWRK